MIIDTDIEIAADGIVRQAAGDPDRFDAFIPSPCVQNHAANLMPLANGDLACVWFGGTQEGMSDISVYFSRLPRGAILPPGPRWVVVAFEEPEPPLLLTREDFLRRLDRPQGPK